MLAIQEVNDKVAAQQEQEAAIAIQKTWRGYRLRDTLWVRVCAGPLVLTPRRDATVVAGVDAAHPVDFEADGDLLR